MKCILISIVSTNVDCEFIGFTINWYAADWQILPSPSPDCAYQLVSSSQWAYGVVI